MQKTSYLLRKKILKYSNFWGVVPRVFQKCEDPDPRDPPPPNRRRPWHYTSHFYHQLFIFTARLLTAVDSSQLFANISQLTPAPSTEASQQNAPGFGEHDSPAENRTPAQRYI